MTALAGRKPDWLRVRFPTGGGYERLRDLMREQELHTVCEEARCPNIGDCWNRGTATFMILGDTCTRACGFCAVTTGRPGELDHGEPKRVALAVERMGLRHAVITSVNRDDVSDGGAGIFAETIRWTRRLSPGTTIEVVGPALAEPRVGVTDLEGRYRITGLPPGTYAVTLRLPGFGSAFRDGVVVGAGLAPRVDAELVVGEMDYLGDGVDLDARGPAGSGGAIALECMFLPSGAIVNCRRVDVVGQLSPHWR